MSGLELHHEHSGWAWLLLFALPPLLWWAYGRRRTPGVSFSSTAALARIPRGWRTRLGWIPPLLRTGALLLLVVALAGPRKGNEQTRIPAEGIAIQLIVDRSSSMLAEDFEIAGRRANRLAAVKDVVRDFVRGAGPLTGRQEDLLGLVTFAGYADERCPLTLDHGYLIDVLDATEAATTADEDGTAIGDAVALGVERIRALEEQQAQRGGEKIKSKVLILLTDGENNAGDIAPLKAAEIAAAFDVKVYTIGAGTHGLAPVPVLDRRTGAPLTDPRTGRPALQRVPVSIDEKTLREIAQATGGAYFRATDTDSLREIYAAIDRMEKTRTQELRFFQYTELATHSVQLGPVRLPPLLLAAFVLLGLEVLSRTTWLRRVP